LPILFATPMFIAPLAGAVSGRLGAVFGIAVASSVFSASVRVRPTAELQPARALVD
jgi:hypothetical protein